MCVFSVSSVHSVVMDGSSRSIEYTEGTEHTEVALPILTETQMTGSQMIVFVKVPIPSTVTSQVSPDTIFETPDGVPVAITSPALSVI